MKDNIDRLLEYINSQTNPRAFTAALLALSAPDPVTAGLVIGAQLAEVNP